MDGVIHDHHPLALVVVGGGAGAGVLAGVTVDQGLLLQGENAVWTGMTGAREALVTALSQSIVHLHQKRESAACLPMGAEARKRERAHRQRSASKLNSMGRITAEAQKETRAGAL